MRIHPVILAVLVLAALTTVAAAMVVTLPPTPMPGEERGYFLINSIPSGGDVYFDGSFWGETPVTIPVSTTGSPSHTIRITLSGYQEWVSSYNGNPGPDQTIPITATLTPTDESGNIQVYSSPSGALVTLDRGQSATTPYTFGHVPVGSHEVAVYLSGYQTFYTTVGLSRGQTATVNAVLTPVTTTGSLSVSSTPSGAAVYVDGNYRGVTSTSVGNLLPGQHTVRLVRSGYQDWTGTASIGAGTTTYLDATLVRDPQPVSGTVSLSTIPPGADAYVDGVYVGQTRAQGPLTLSGVTPGTHTFRFTKQGYQDYAGTGLVQAGQNYVMSVTLNQVPNPTTGDISIVSAPSQAQVYLNNAFRGITPLTLEGLAPGSYTVLLKMNGYVDWQATQQVTAGQTAQISATLSPQPTPTPTRAPLFPLTLLGALGLAVFVVKRKI